MSRLRQVRRWLRRRAGLLLLLALLGWLIESEGPPPGALATRVNRIIADVQFDLWRWEVEATAAKFVHWLLQPQRYMSEPDRTTLVRGYAGEVGQIQLLQWEIEMAYADPAVEDPETATAPLRAQEVLLRTYITARQPVAEAIIEEQVGAILAQEGIGFLGQPFPQVGVRFTPLPSVLVISPRQHIETIHQEELKPGLGTAQWEAIEAEVDRTFDVSSLVSSIGGMSAWPAMLLEHPSLDWVLEVAAHEWTHHYLTLYPLGWDYDRYYDARVINETTASIVGKEVGRKVLARYYPDLVPPPVEPSPEPQGPPEPPAFDFRGEMHQTRVEVDRLLAEGQVEEAERYMEERRRFFWENGYQIRKLNQAYFAFHGSYADEPGAAGEDPIGPAVWRLRAQSPTLRAFLSSISSITTLEELQVALMTTAGER